MDAHDVIHGHREHAKRIGLAQILLAAEGKFRQVGKVLEIIRMHAGGVELAAVVRHALIDPGQGLLETGQLQSRDLVAAGGFYRLEGRNGTDGSHGAHFRIFRRFRADGS